MTVDLRTYVDFLCKKKITPNQFLFCYILYCEEFVKTGGNYGVKKEGVLYKYVNEGPKDPNTSKQLWSLAEIDDLETKGYIIDTNKNKGGIRLTSPDKYIITESFCEDLYIMSGDAGEDFWEIYPTYFEISGNPNPIPTKTTSMGKDGLIEQYYKAIGQSLQKHKEVMEITKWGVSKGYINCGIEKYVMNRMWEGLHTLMVSKAPTNNSRLFDVEH